MNVGDLPCDVAAGKEVVIELLEALRSAEVVKLDAHGASLGGARLFVGGLGLQIASLRD